MKTNWKEHYIGEVLSGYLVGGYIYIYQTNYIIITHNKKIAEYVSGDTIVDYKEISQNDKKKIGGTLMGSMLFGVPGAMAMGNQTNYVLEVTWFSNEKSLIQIEGSEFHNFFISKLYEKSPIKEKDNLDYFNEFKNEVKEKKAELNKLLNKDDIYNAYCLAKNNIEYFRININECDEYNYKYELEKYKSISDEYNTFLENQNFKQLINIHDIREKCGCIQHLKMIKNGNLLVKQMYDEKELLLKIGEEYYKYSNIENEQLMNVITKDYEFIIYNKMKEAHNIKGYIFFSNDKSIQLEQINNLKNKLSNEIYLLLIKISNHYAEKNFISYTGVNLNDCSSYLISTIVNSLFDNYELEFLEIVKVNANVYRHYKELQKIGNNREKENAYFDSLDVNEHSDYFTASDIYVDEIYFKKKFKFIIEEKETIHNNEIINNKKNSIFDFNDIYNKLEYYNNKEKLKYNDINIDKKRTNIICDYIKNKDNINQYYIPLNFGGVTFTNGYSLFYILPSFLPNTFVYLPNMISDKEKKEYLEKYNIDNDLLVNDGHDIFDILIKALDDMKVKFIFPRDKVEDAYKEKKEFVELDISDSKHYFNPKFLLTALKILNIPDDNIIAYSDLKYTIIIKNDKGEYAVILGIKKY